MVNNDRFRWNGVEINLSFKTKVKQIVEGVVLRDITDCVNITTATTTHPPNGPLVSFKGPNPVPGVSLAQHRFSICKKKTN